MKRLISLAILAGLLAGCATSEKLVKLSDETLPKSTTISVATVVEVLNLTIEKDKLKIERSTQTAQIGGSGVFISPNGHILTCAHLMSVGVPGDVTVCQYDGTCQKADVIYKEERLDLMLLKVEVSSPVPYARLADPRKLRVGQEVLAIGNPLRFGFTVTHGIISALNRDELGVYNMTQSDAFINPGNSGGPLFNLKGELIGINSRIVPPVDAPIFTGLGFSVQSGQILEFLTRFRGIDRAFRTPRGVWSGFLEAIGISQN